MLERHNAPMGQQRGDCPPKRRRMHKNSNPIEIGSRREPIVDHFLIDHLDGVRLALQKPRDEGPVLRRDKPWEGLMGYFTVIKDGDTYRTYYRGDCNDGTDGGPDEVTCYAESADGHHWTKPNLGVVEIEGSRDNNVVLGPESPAVRHNFTPFLDTGPARGDLRLKGLGGLFKHDKHDTTTHGLLLYGSDDGIHWRQLREEPVIDQSHRGPTVTDTCSIPAFWSEVEERYICYLRDWIGPPKRPGHAGSIRWIARSTSRDLFTWTPLEKMSYEPVEHLYTSNVVPYFRAPHIAVALPARFMKGRQVATLEECRALGLTPDYVEDCSDAVFMTSRGGTAFDRTFEESFIRPGIGPNNWVTRTNYPATGVVPTGPHEMSLYLMQDNAQKTVHLRRYSLRLDGFASVNAPYNGGEMVTRPLIFTGSRLEINFSTSSAGSIRVELQEAGGKPLAGYAIEDAPELVGNHIEKEVTWTQGPDVAHLAGRAVRLRFVMRDADLFALRFR